MKIIVTGGRDYSDVVTVVDVLDALMPTAIVEGGATGADHLARCWARRVGVPHHTVAADWVKHGKAAGPIRNGEMLKEHPNAIVIAFPGGKGTEDCVKQARKLKRIVLRVEP